MLYLILGGFVVLTALYALISAYSRSTRREALENEFDAGGKPGFREDYVAAGMRDYEHSLRKRLILLVYVIPVVLIVGIAYVVNHT